MEEFSNHRGILDSIESIEPSRTTATLHYRRQSPRREGMSDEDITHIRGEVVVVFFNYAHVPRNPRARTSVLIEWLRSKVYKKDWIWMILWLTG